MLRPAQQKIKGLERMQENLEMRFVELAEERERMHVQLPSATTVVLGAPLSET